MINLKNITELPVAESADGLNLIVNDNGAAKQIAASAVGAQADWSVIDASSPAFIKNKPVIPEGFSGSWNDLKDKPFYAETENKVFIERQIAEFRQIDEVYRHYIALSNDIYNYKEVDIIWDGVSYRTDISTLQDGHVDGKDGIFYIRDDNGQLYFSTFDESPTHEIGISYTGEIVHKLDAKYLPPTYDFVIVANNDYTAELVVGDYDTIYNKLINGEFVDGRVIVYYWTGEDESTNYFSVSRIHTRLEISLGNIDDVACINFLLMDDDGHYCTIKNDNTVYYWSVD